MARIAKRRARWDALARALAKPVAPAIPPGASALLRAGKPLLGVGGIFGARVIPGLGIAGRVQDALDMAGAAQDELWLAAHELCGRVATLPGSDVVGDASGDESVYLHLGEVDRRAQDLDAARLDQWVFQGIVHQLDV